MTPLAVSTRSLMTHDAPALPPSMSTLELKAEKLGHADLSDLAAGATILVPDTSPIVTLMFYAVGLQYRRVWVYGPFVAGQGCDPIVRNSMRNGIHPRVPPAAIMTAAARTDRRYLVDIGYYEGNKTSDSLLYADLLEKTSKSHRAIVLTHVQSPFILLLATATVDIIGVGSGSGRIHVCDQRSRICTDKDRDGGREREERSKIVDESTRVRWDRPSTPIHILRQRRMPVFHARLERSTRQLDQALGRPSLACLPSSCAYPPSRSRFDDLQFKDFFESAPRQDA
ncbi:hypothetical protein C8R45DRAFT_1099852 [Mycena sanguinolenta]|nr:hypothetical protein C8R45DRAFT_1099852 [Mycena sanguinolenta]